jgi:HAD superfamily hydrolase (TIGR01509 family)
MDTAVPAILRWYGLEPTPDLVAEQQQWLLDRVVQLFRSGVPVLPGVGELLAALSAEGLAVALVSSSYRVLVDAVLESVGPFGVTVAGDEVENGKPHPEPYLTACRRLRVDPARCVVLEDSAAGVASGEAAGCAVVAVPSVRGVSFAPAPRRLVADSLETVDVGALHRLVRS